MMRTTVVNKRDLMYIGRGSIWGNPFKVTITTSRIVAIEKYRPYIKKKLQESPKLYNLDKLRGKILVCFCKPQACHGDILVELLDMNWRPGKGEEK